ncbi:MAG: hypothetical protein KJ811_01900 [Candidatus Margulisbacteria bacterium]|nr:hypothetical protein [Candidatus Margulisiibacteriota bacterium]
MSILTDGLNNVYSLTAQINNLRSMDPANLTDPKELTYALQQSFNQMLNSLISSTNKSSDDEDDKTNDYFSFLTSNSQASLESLQAQGIIDAAVL